MPQLDPSVYSSQIFWLIVSFLLMFVLMSKLIAPKLGDIFGQRQRKIDDNISTAMEFKQAAEEVLDKYESLLEKATIEADKMVKKTEENVEQLLAKKQHELDVLLADELSKNQQKMDELKDEMLLYVEKTSRDLSDKILDKLGLDASERGGK